MTTQAERNLSRVRARLTASQAREAALTDQIRAAILVLDDMGSSAYDREQTAAAILEVAIGRPPRRDPIP